MTIKKQINQILTHAQTFSKADFSSTEKFITLAFSRLLSKKFINEKGEFDWDSGEKALKELPDQSVAQQEYLSHALSIINLVKQDKEAQMIFRRLSPPLSSAWAENVVKMSVESSKALLSACDIKRAVFSALLTPLRQTIGSCFATSVAILLQKTQSLAVLKDLCALLLIGTLRRSVEGEEIKIPMSISIGFGHLQTMLQDAESASHHLGLIKGLEALQWIDVKPDLQQKVVEANKFIRNLSFPISQMSVGAFIDNVMISKYPTKFQPSKPQSSSELRHVSVQEIAKQHLQEKISEERIVLENSIFSFYEHALLKTWEYTLASFVDHNRNLSKMHMTTALGFDTEEELSLADHIKVHLEEKLAVNMTKIQELEEEVYTGQQKMSMVERLMQSASDPHQIRRLKAEHQTYFYQVNTCLDLRKNLGADNEEYAKFLAFLLKQYHSLFVLYFQEIFDPSVSYKSQHLWQDSPAGFRLVYKHGRMEPSVWTPITNGQDYIEAIIDFFRITESIIVNACEWERGKEEVSNIVTSIMAFINQPQFLKAAEKRIEALHKRWKGVRCGSKPWSYISGGTTTNLIKGYFDIQSVIKEEIFSPTSEADLCIKIIDFLKEVPFAIQERCAKDERFCFLMQSPTHAFNLQPGHETFFPVWEGKDFTYTWLRDFYIEPAKNLYQSMILTKDQQQYLCDKIAQILPDFHPPALLVSEISLEGFAKDIQVPSGLIESIMKTNLPLFGSKQLSIIAAHFHCRATKFPSLVNPQELVQILSMKTKKQELQIIKELVRKHFLPLRPLIFADSNWPNNYFAFAVDPISLELKFWRCSPNGLQLNVMQEWQKFFNGDSTWSIFADPAQYTVP